MARPIEPQKTNLMTFDELSLDPRILAAVKGAGYTTPTPIQEQGIPAVLGGRDITGIAQTGTGKTAAFVLPMIHKLGQGRAKARMPRSLILEPTRELAAQVAEQFEKYGAGYKLNMALLIGGVSFGDQEKKLNAGVDVLIATPGRLMDHFERGGLLMTGVQMLVIDEADRMLDMGFIPDIEKICTLLPKTRQTLLFSATMPPEITRLAKQFQKEPVRIEVSKPATTADDHHAVRHALPVERGHGEARRAALDHQGAARPTRASCSATARRKSTSSPSRWPATASTPRRSTATCRRASAPRRSTVSATRN